MLKLVGERLVTLHSHVFSSQNTNHKGMKSLPKREPEKYFPSPEQNAVLLLEEMQHRNSFISLILLPKNA